MANDDAHPIECDCCLCVCSRDLLFLRTIRYIVEIGESLPEPLKRWAAAETDSRIAHVVQHMRAHTEAEADRVEQPAEPKLN